MISQVAASISDFAIYQITLALVFLDYTGLYNTSGTLLVITKDITGWFAYLFNLITYLSICLLDLRLGIISERPCGITRNLYEYKARTIEE